MALFMQLTPQWSGERNGRSGRAAISPTVEWRAELVEWDGVWAAICCPPESAAWYNGTIGSHGRAGPDCAVKV